MRLFSLLLALGVASCIACCGCGDLIHAGYAMLVHSDKWMTTSGWLNLGVATLVIAAGVVIAQLGFASHASTKPLTGDDV